MWKCECAWYVLSDFRNTWVLEYWISIEVQGISVILARTSMASFHSFPWGVWLSSLGSDDSSFLTCKAEGYIDFQVWNNRRIILGGGNSHIFYFHPETLGRWSLPGKWSKLTTVIFFKWVAKNHQLDILTTCVNFFAIISWLVNLPPPNVPRNKGLIRPY